jgi:hypothetical protein
MRLVLFLAAAVYWAAMTAWLLVPEAAGVIGLEGPVGFPWKDHGLLFSAFGLLAVLAHACRWPKKVGWPVLALVAYALLIEGFETYLSSRPAEFGAFLADLAGVAAGTALYWAVWHLAQPRTTRRDRHAILRAFLDLQRLHE